MSLAKWDPLREITALQQSVNRLLDENLPRWPQRAGIAPSAMAFPVDVQETTDSITIKAELPGMQKEDIKIHFVNNQLTIQGERKQEKREEEARYLKVERSYGAFCRTFTLDIPVEHDQIKANYKEGILEIVLPKKEETRPKEIEIN